MPKIMRLLGNRILRLVKHARNKSFTDKRLLDRLEELGMALLSRPHESSLKFAIQELEDSDTIFNNNPTKFNRLFIQIINTARDTNYALAGGLAIRAYIRKRPTIDIDLLVDEKDVDLLLEKFRQRGFALRKALLGYVARKNKRDILDVIIAKEDPEKEALKHTYTTSFMGKKIRILQPEYLALLKFRTFRERDIDDVKSLIKSGVVNIKKLTRLVEKYYPDLEEDLEQIIKISEL